MQPPQAQAVKRRRLSPVPAREVLTGPPAAHQAATARGAARLQRPQAWAPVPGVAQGWAEPRACAGSWRQRRQLDAGSAPADCATEEQTYFDDDKGHMKPCWHSVTLD